jgi:hypothetical protein
MSPQSPAGQSSGWASPDPRHGSMYKDPMAAMSPPPMSTGPDPSPMYMPQAMHQVPMHQMPMQQMPMQQMPMQQMPMQQMPMQQVHMQHMPVQGSYHEPNSGALELASPN